MTSVEARAEAEWRFPVTAYECPEDQATEVERFVAGAEWQAERDGERVAKLETEVERLNDALDAADVRYQMLGDWGERMKADAERVAELEAEVERVAEQRDGVAVTAEGMTRYARAAEAKIAAVRALHFPVDDPIHPGLVCAHRYCRDDFGGQYVWPCPTSGALDGGGDEQ